MASKGTALAPFLEEAARHLPISFSHPFQQGAPAGTPAGSLRARLRARLRAQSMLSRTMPPVGTPPGTPVSTTQHALSYHAARRARWCRLFSRPHHACSLAPCTSESDSTHVFHVQLHIRLHPIAASRRTPDLFRTVLASLRLRCKKQGLALLRKVRCEQMPSLSLAQRLARAHLFGLMAISCGR